MPEYAYIHRLKSLFFPKTQRISRSTFAVKTISTLVFTWVMLYLLENGLARTQLNWLYDTIGFAPEHFMMLFSGIVAYVLARLAGRRMHDLDRRAIAVYCVYFLFILLPLCHLIYYTFNIPLGAMLAYYVGMYVSGFIGNYFAQFALVIPLLCSIILFFPKGTDGINNYGPKP